MTTFWKCRQCYGTGKQLICDEIVECYRCAGTGNAFVDGAEEYHKRRLREIEERKASPHD